MSSKLELWSPEFRYMSSFHLAFALYSQEFDWPLVLVSGRESLDSQNFPRDRCVFVIHGCRAPR